MATKQSSKKRAEQEPIEQCKIHCGTGHNSWDRCGGSGGCTYVLGFIGAAVYYNVTTVGFWAGVIGVLKAAVWPAFLVFSLLKFLGA